jgi:hypothetical protein
MICGDLNYHKDILAKFKLVQKSCGRVEIKSNDLWQSLISSKKS